jgi:hypothetical protein
MKKRELVKKIAEVGCVRIPVHFGLTCETCPLVYVCIGINGSIKAANEYLIAHPKGDKPCPHCGGSGNVVTVIKEENGTATAMPTTLCHLCLGSKKRIKRAELEAEVVRLRGEECK